ncbi:hypothetical protein D3C85_1055670 [compost metagenome]
MQGVERQCSQFQRLARKVHALERALHRARQHLVTQRQQGVVHPQVGIRIGQLAARRLQQRTQFGGFHREGPTQMIQAGAQGYEPQRPASAKLVHHTHRILAQTQVQRRPADMGGRRAAHAVAQVAVQHQDQLQSGVQVFMHPLGPAEAQRAAGEGHRGRRGGYGPIWFGASRGYGHGSGRRSRTCS